MGRMMARPARGLLLRLALLAAGLHSVLPFSALVSTYHGRAQLARAAAGAAAAKPTGQVSSPRQGRTWLEMAGSSMIAPPNSPTRKKRLGGGGSDDGLRKLSVEEYEKTLNQWLKDWRKRNQGRAMESLKHPDVDLMNRMLSKTSELSDNGRTPKFALGLFHNGRVVSVAVVELLRRKMPWTLSIDVLHSHPKFGKKTSRTMLSELKTMAEENALQLDLTPLREIDALAPYILENTVEIEAPQATSDDPKLNEYRKVLARFPSLVLDGLPEDADLGPYWYCSKLPDGVEFFFKRRSRRHNEFFVSVDNPETAGPKKRQHGQPARSPREMDHGHYPVIHAAEVPGLRNFSVPGKKFINPICRSLSHRLHQLKASGGGNNGPSRGRRR
uniref:Uncharacterized protein n=2 Tax=Phaeomonas parva TaxID=124430 RepID=A0A6U4CJ36_9STRA|mmetsp:Transcript_14255/g.42667  ORF Transcript_14255/g.42667 Transcript_14255/m.42667 type:complete len:386 (+) Transcript_14255:157-1314(+)